MHMNEIGIVWYTHSVNLELHVWTVVKEKLHLQRKQMFWKNKDNT